MGRLQITLTDEQKAELPELAAYLSYDIIADYFGICRRTFHNILRRDPKAMASYKKGKVEKKLRYAKCLDEVAGGRRKKKQDVAAIIFFLKTKGGWSEKHEPQSFAEENVETEEERTVRLREAKLFAQWKRNVSLPSLEKG